ncbi:MAG: hypothetical protein NTX45_02170 [Proteobacteria bacterium]|nr:hypothetical protein [Pseudomonadota bacterium]
MTQVGEPVAPGVMDPLGEETKLPKCKKIYLHAFSGGRTPEYIGIWKASLAQHKENNTAGPGKNECLHYAGHVGISFEEESTIYGFTPNSGSDPGWKAIENLMSKDAEINSYPGQVSDDTDVFNTAPQDGLVVKKIELLYPEPAFNDIKQRFTAKQSDSGLRYSFPGGSGDCNCATWPAQIGVFIPSIDGNLRNYMRAFNEVTSPKRMGLCEE